MNITILLAAANMSGGVRVVATYAEALQLRGHNVTIVYRNKPVPSLSRRIKNFLRGRGWVSASHQFPSHIDGLHVNKIRVDSTRPISNSDLPEGDVVIATWWETAEWMSAFTPDKGTPVYFVQHHEVHSHLPVERVKETLRLPINKITIANWLMDLLINEYNTPNHQAALVPNGVDTQLFTAPPREKGSPLTLLMMYSPAEFKGCDIIIDAVKKVYQHNPNIRLVIFSAFQPVETIPIPEWAEFHYLPSQDKLKALYSEADVYLFGSRCEGYGLPILEAMACRTPVIGTKTGAAPELISEGGGISIETTADDMANAIITFEKMDGNEWKRCSDAAYATASHHTWSHSIDLFEQALQRLATRGSVGEENHDK